MTPGPAFRHTESIKETSEMSTTAPQPEDHCELTSYAELASILSALPLLLREERRRRRLSARATAKQLGCSFATVSRIEAGHDCALSNAAAVLRWLNTPPVTA